MRNCEISYPHSFAYSYATILNMELFPCSRLALPEAPNCAISHFRNFEILYFTTSYALTFHASSAKQMAQTTNKAPQEHHSGGSLITNSRTTLSLKSVSLTVS